MHDPTATAVPPTRREPAIAGIVIFLAMGTWAVVGLLRTRPIESFASGGATRPPLSGRIDPNTAPWWELSQLPGIGETRAKQIVAYREQVRARRGSELSPVFRTPADLTKVSGIGPATVSRLTSLLTLQ